MSALIAHLTDLHIKANNDPVLGRADIIARAIASEVDSDVEVVVLALGGDSAYSGSPAQFSAAHDFYRAIERKLRQERPAVEIVFVVVAGNHDCVFDVREPEAGADAHSETGPPDVASGALDNYFAFTQQLGLTYTAHTKSSPFFTWCDIPVGAQLLRFLLVNTSVRSSLHEKEGTLTAPIEQLIPRFDSAASYVVGLLHHPWNWFKQPETMRPLRDRIEALSDVILTGHEHSPEVTDLTRDNDIASLYISGGVLQETGDPTESSFIVIKLDLAGRTRSAATFQLDASGYYQRLAASSELSFPGNPARVGKAYTIRDSFAEKLDDLGFLVHHPRKQFLRLSDIYIYPDLSIVDEPMTSTSSKQLKSRDVAATALSQHKVLISGGEKGGKTCLSKSLYRDAFESGRLPVLLDGAKIEARKGSAIREYVRRAVREQYLQPTPDQYEQTDKSRRVLIIDDFHEMVDVPEARAALLREFEQIFSTIILIGAETFCFDLLDADARHESRLWEYTHYNVLSFGEALRERFVRKWVTLGDAITAPLDVQEQTSRRELLAGRIRLAEGRSLRTTGNMGSASS